MSKPKIDPQPHISYMRELVETRLGRSLDEWIEANGFEGESVRALCDRLEAATKVRVSKSAMHEWLSK